MPDTINTGKPDLPLQRGISWAAVIAGSLVAIALSFLIHVFNLGLGISAFSIHPSGVLIIKVSGIFWLIICSILTMLVAGWVAGWLSRRLETPTPFSGILHGFLAWSLALLIGLGFASSFAPSFFDNPPSTPGHEIQKRANNAAGVSEPVEDPAGVIALGAFFTFFFGAVAASLGGYYGANRPFKKW